MKSHLALIILVLSAFSAMDLSAMSGENGMGSASENCPAGIYTESINRGRKLFDFKCRFCHNPYSTEMLTGPGLKGVLKNKDLPVSRRSATIESIKKQLRQPFERMPSFDYLSEKEIDDLIAYLRTL